MRILRKKRGFTLIELLFVFMAVAFIVVLMVPVIKIVNDYKARSVCADNIRQIGLAIYIYAQEHQGKFPPDIATLYAKKYLTKSLVAVVNKDSRGLAESMFDMGMVTGDVDFDSFSTDLDYMLRKYSGMSLNKVNFGEVLADILHLMNRHHTRMPPSLALLTMTLWSVEALVRNIDPDFNSFEASRPFVTEVIAKSLNPISRMKSLGRNAGEYYDLLDGFPRRIGRVMSKVEKGELKIMFQDEKLENLNIVMEKSSNRLIIGAIVSTMILASSLLSLSGENPVFMGVEVLKALIALGSLLGLWLVFTIVRSGKY